MITAALDQAQPLGQVLIDERLTHLPATIAQAEAVRIMAAQPPTVWDAVSHHIAERLRTPATQIRRELLTTVQAWNHDPQAAAQDPLAKSNAVKTRLTDRNTTPEERWHALAAELDPRLLHQADWPATAALLQAGHNQGHDITAATRAVVKDGPLGALPAQDLRYRLLAKLDLPLDEPPPRAPQPPTPAGTKRTPTAHQISPTPTPTPRR
jgi:hypothetical protein